MLRMYICVLVYNTGVALKDKLEASMNIEIVTYVV